MALPAVADRRPGGRGERSPGLRSWVELAMVGGFYALYSLVRDLGGHSVALATANAGRVIDVERSLHIFDEARVQLEFVHDLAFVEVLNDYYSTVHFVAVAAVLVWLYRRQPERYRFWRNTLAVCTGLALVGYTVFPLLPPRLLEGLDGVHMEDTLNVVGGLWDFSSGPIAEVANQLAAMPSLHTAWAAWCALAVAPALRHRSTPCSRRRTPAATVFCIVVTGNHYFADAAGGLAALGVALLLTGSATRLVRPPLDPPEVAANRRTVANLPRR